MAPKRETSLDLCSRVTTQGNTISIRMLEYLSTAKHPIHGFQPLATEFLELCKVAWSIEAGLTEANQKRSAFPPEVTQDLDKKFRQINDEFLVLNQMLQKFVENENNKGGFGRRFRMMFADTDVEKMRMTISRSRESLRVSSAMFRWTLGETKADASIGIGYTGLAAALERMNPSRQPILPPQQPPPVAALPEPPVERYQSPLPPSPMVEKQPLASIHTRSDHHRNDDHGLSQNIVDLHNNWRAPSIRSSERSTHSIRDTVYHRNGLSHGEPMFDDSDDSRGSRTLIEDHLNHLDLNEKFPNEPAFHKMDVAGSPRWTPRQSGGSKPAGGKAALINAVEQKKHRTLEQLLDGGARADNKMEAGMLRTAIENRDAESVALLLRYGADANGFDKEGYTPLFSATQVSFFEGAKILLKHGADPNLSAGSDSETPLCLATTENRVDFVQMYLKNGGDANYVMASGSTTLVQAMNKTTSAKLVEILLTAGAKPDEKNGDGATALFQAIQANRVDLMTVLLDNGANPNLPAPKHPLWPATYKPRALQLLLQRGGDHKKTPGIMELAASLKKMESISILINAGVSPNVRKDGTYTPLCSAIRDNSADIVTYLLDNGADPNMKASEYPAFKCITHNRVHFLPQLVTAGADLHTPKGIIETAVAHNNKDAIMYLLDQGVNPNDRTPEGRTALTTAIRDDRSEIVDLLLANGADPAVRGEEWPLCMAVKRPAILKKLLGSISNPRAFKGVIEMAVVANQLESIKLLLNAGVSVEDKNCGVFSPLTTAIREERKDIVRFLLDEANADPNAPGEHLPIVKALRRYSGDTEILVMILTRGADINKMHRGWNAVLQAVENGDADILKLLIEKGGPVDLQALDESGRPVVDIVTERGWEEGLALLFPNAQGKQ